MLIMDQIKTKQKHAYHLLFSYLDMWTALFAAKTVLNIFSLIDAEEWKMGNYFQKQTRKQRLGALLLFH